MTETKKQATASPTKKPEKIETPSDTVKTQLATASLQIASLTAERDMLKQENVELKQANLDLTNVLENDLKSDLIVRIQAASQNKYTPNELQHLNVEKLKDIEEVLVKAGAFTNPATFKNINAGNAGFNHDARLTVGSLYKNPKELT